jgi:uncharacterized membrane protein
LGVTDAVRELSGRRAVAIIYVVVVAITAGFGFIIGLVGPEGLDPELFGLVQLPPTPVGMAVYGVLTVGTILLVLMGVMNVVSSLADADRVE